VAAIVIVVGLLNVLGCAMCGRSPLFLWEYLQYLGRTHKGVVYNRAELNPTITSWNRLLYVLGGPLIELGPWLTLAGYLAWFSLAALRPALARVPPSPAWLAACCAVGGLLCSQVLSYELLFLVLVLPWVRLLLAGGYGLRGWMAVALLALQLIPVRAMADLGLVFDDARGAFHNALGVALLAALVIAGPVDPAHRADE
jgi:hypothetical protein